MGTDVHLEYYFAHQSLLYGWDTSVAHAYNSSIALNIIAPALGHLVGLENVFKWVFPVLYSFVPVILYFIFRRFITPAKAFWGVVFFMIIPTFFIEITGIAKEQIGELFFVLAILSLIDRKYILLVIFGSLTAMSHYSMGFLLVFFLIVYTVGIPILTKLLHKPSLASLWPLVLAVVAVTTISGVYLGNVADGVALKSASYVGSSYVTNDTDNQFSAISWQEYLNVTHRDPVVQTALGLDFMNVPSEGKIFRITQFGIQFLVVVGVLVCIRRRLRAEMVALVGASCMILLLCVFVPSFASILNPSRFYHVAFFFLPLALLLGADFLFRSHWQYWVAGIATVFFLFSSGFVFERLKLTPDSINVPYSIALSHDRLDIGTRYTEDDQIVAKWLAEQTDLPPIMADTYGLLIIQERLGLSPLYMFNEKQEFVDNCWLFLRGYNTETQQITIWLGAGLRKQISFDEAGLLPLMQNPRILFSSGGSVVLGYGEG